MKRLFYLMFVATLLVGCTSLKTPEINGVVVDAETGRPIEGAYVVASWAPMYGTVGGNVGGEVSKKIRLQTDKNGIFRIPSHLLINWAPYPCGKGGDFSMSIYTHEYKHEGYIFYSKSDLENPKYAAFKGVTGGNRLIIKLQLLKNSEMFHKNSDEIYGLVENDPSYRLKDYQLYIEKFPKGEEVPGYLLSIGSIYEKMKKSEKALQAYRQVIDQFPDTAASHEAHKDILRLSNK